MRDLKRATEVLAWLLNAGLSQTDAFIESCHYGFTQIEQDGASVIQSIMEERGSIQTVLPEFKSLSVTPSALQSSLLISSISEGIAPFITRLADECQEPRTKALLGLLSTLIRAEDAEARIAGRTTAYGALANDFIHTLILRELEGGLADHTWYTRQITVHALSALYQARIANEEEADVYPIEPLLHDEAWAVRQATVEALGAIYPAIISRGDNANVGALEGALHDRSWVVRKATARALGNVYGALIEQGREV
ncbi:MAG: HEAT repeat domain-containing protein, partial [Halobacteriota archaeon]